MPLVLLVGPSSAAESVPCANPDYAHAISYLLPLKYGADYTHFDYTNPAAPKTGRMRLPVMGTFDNYNAILEKGRVAAGYDDAGGLVYDRLLEPSIDEPVSAYGRLADGIAKGPGLDWIAFRIRDDAYWHDGVPITLDDVLFTFEALREHGSVSIRTALADIERIFPFGEREVCFVRRQDRELNPILPFAIGNYNILPKHYWDAPEHDITKTTVDPPLASGPYRLKYAEVGRVIEYERVDDYWGRDIPVNKGRYNFDEITFDHFADEGVMLEAHKGHVFDIREEGVSKNWATQYDFPAVREGLFKRELRPLGRVEGLWWPIFWNTERTQLADIRVREALWLLYDFDWTNRVLFYGFYKTGLSFFQNSPMAHKGLPSERELALLEPWRDQLPPRVFTEEFKQPRSTGFGRQRHNIARAIELFAEAGWEIQDGVMTNVETGEPFTLDFIGVSYYSIRQNLSLVDNLKRVGIRNSGRSPEVSQWAVPQPHRPLRRQFGAPGSRPHPRAATAQLVRQRRRRPGLRPELGQDPQPSGGQPDRDHRRRGIRRGTLRRHPGPGPRAVVELLLHPARLAARFSPRLLGQVRRNPQRQPQPPSFRRRLVVRRSQGPQGRGGPRTLGRLGVDGPSEGRHSAFPGAPIGALLPVCNEVSALARAREGRMPSLRRPIRRRSDGCRHALAAATGPGGEGILPSLAPSGAHGLSTFERMRLAAHREGKMPSPPGPVPSRAPRRLPHFAPLRTTGLRREGVPPSTAPPRRVFPMQHPSCRCTEPAPAGGQVRPPPLAPASRRRSQAGVPALRHRRPLRPQRSPRWTPAESPRS